MTAVSTTTTTNVKSPYRVWGKNLQILFCLSEFGGLTVREISEKTGVLPDTVGKNCKRNVRRGLIEPVSMWGFRLTPTGSTIVSYNNNNNRGQITDKQRTNNGQITDKQRTNKQRKKRQLNLSLFSDLENLSSDVVVVAEALVAHYEKTGRPYYLVKDYYEFKTELGLSRLRDEDIMDIVIRLDNEGFLYNIRKGEYRKIGILKETVERLQWR